MWIYGTISSSLLDTVLKTRCSARDLWVTIENLLHDNKEARAIQLENELRSLTIGDMSVHEYCQKLKTTTDLLANIDSPVTYRAVVMHMLNGLSEKFDNIHNVIKHRSPFPSFYVARSMLIMEEDRINKHTKSTSPQVLHACSTQGNVPPGQTSNYVNNCGDQHQQYYQGNSRNNQNRERGRGRSNNYRGRGRNQNNWNNQSNWTQQPVSWQPQPPPQFWQQQNWNQNQQQWRPAPGPMAYQITASPSPNAGILGPYQQSASGQTHYNSAATCSSVWHDDSTRTSGRRLVHGHRSNGTCDISTRT
ncbi:uncharacterized protein LOC106411960 [Brassica napus]|uniref:uncharacterized protein LOC106411960 n=1 Tax=Brassica napus TaxID=3708 RepID=UPI00207A925A|nr:uncharacterized protein LOC106411960 [Brassica napus]